MDRPATFWDFSVGAYRQPGVADACLSLQERYGLDVNLLFFCCWFGCTRGPLDASTFRLVLSFAEPWANEVVRPLRAARTWMKTTGCGRAGIAETRCMALRDKIKGVEFEAERLQQNTLEDLVSAAAAEPLEGARQLGANALNLRRYLRHHGTELDETSLAALALIAAAAIGSDSPTVLETLNTTFQET